MDGPLESYMKSTDNRLTWDLKRLRQFFKKNSVIFLGPATYVMGHSMSNDASLDMAHLKM